MGFFKFFIKSAVRGSADPLPFIFNIGQQEVKFKKKWPKLFIIYIKGEYLTFMLARSHDIPASQHLETALTFYQL